MERVLQIMGGLNRGGLETFVINMYRSIDRTKIQFDFLLTQISGGDYADEVKALGANVYAISPRNKGYRKYIKDLNSFFREHHNYIAIHQHISSLTSIEPVRYAMKYKIPIRILHAHSSAISNNLKYHILHNILHYLNKPLVHKYANVYLGCSHKALNWIYNFTGVRTKAKMINNGIDIQLYTFNTSIRGEVRKELNISNEEFVIGHVGRFIPIKNHIFLINIFYDLQKINPQSRLILVGDGELNEKIHAQIKELGIDNKVIFTGVRRDVNRILQAMDIFVMPSIFEGLPVSLIEAQAAGLPIIASDTISHDSDVSGNILFKNLQDGNTSWVECIMKSCKKRERFDNREKIQKAGFDSQHTSELLLNIYHGQKI